MAFQNRKQTILRAVQEQGSVEVKDLAQQLNTSEITVRRDLATLAADGLVYRTHGGAMRVEPAKPIDFNTKAAQHLERKEAICRLAAGEIQEGDTIFMDCGSTLFQLCQFIRNKSIRVITNSLPVVYELTNTAVSLNLIGGEVDAERQAVHGLMAGEHIARYRADKAFIGVDGLSVVRGLSAASEKEASIALAMGQQSSLVYLLCDSAKLEQDRYFQFAPLTFITTLVTDAKNDQLTEYRKQIRVLNGSFPEI